MRKPITIHSEIAFLAANIIMGLGVAMLAAADLGMSMTGAPAYLLSQRFPLFTFGMCELFVQLILILMTFCVIRRIRMRLFLSLLSGSVYAAFLDLWRFFIPALNPSITPSGAFSFAERVGLFGIGVLFVAFSVAVFFQCYIYPQSYDLFVRAICRKYGFGKSTVKTAFDCTFLAIGIAMSLLFFSRLQGIGIGTVVLSLSGGSILGFFDKLLCKFFVFQPLFPKAVPLFSE